MRTEAKIEEPPASQFKVESQEIQKGVVFLTDLVLILLNICIFLVAWNLIVRKVCQMHLSLHIHVQNSIPLIFRLIWPTPVFGAQCSKPWRNANAQMFKIVSILICNRCSGAHQLIWEGEVHLHISQCQPRTCSNGFQLSCRKH